MTEDNVSVFFDKYAHDFNAIYGNSNNFFDTVINNLFRKSMRIRYQKSLEGCDQIKDSTVLDVGCGPGHYSIALAKMGAKSIHGIDFADTMLKVAQEKARQEGVEEKCKFEKLDYVKEKIEQKYDYVILMGFMDYMSDPEMVIKKTAAITNKKAFFSFPLDGGFLAWQRKKRYKSRCDLFLYTEKRVRELFSSLSNFHTTIEKIERDLFVTIQVKN